MNILLDKRQQIAVTVAKTPLPQNESPPDGASCGKMVN